MRRIQKQPCDVLSSDALGSRNCRILLFDLSIRGHHPNYIQQLIRYWSEHTIPGSLEMVVSPRFLEEHFDVVELANQLNRDKLKFVAITPEEEAALKSRKSFFSRTVRAFQELQLLCKYAAIAQATHCLMMYFDTAQIPLAAGIKLPCPFSGIYFRPTFHYSELTGKSLSWKEQLQQGREKFILSRVLNHPQCHRLFCLDPFAVQYLQTRGDRHLIHLPDPVSVQPRIAQPKAQEQQQVLRKTLGISPERRVFLLFGALTGRKGIHKVLEAVSMLPPNLTQKLCLLLVGEIKASEETQVEATIAQLRQTIPVQIVTHYQFVTDEEVQYYFQLADVVLATYQQHVGMSGILLLAAAAQKPVLSSDYGLMGELVRRYQLGLVVDSTIAKEISSGLSRYLTESLDQLGDRQKMQQFAEQNSSEHFAQTIFQYL
ncbi:MAG: glycosyltransferase family 4 protein [Scytolyngbya sp. HA4215-MV1]|nr:glycosyltransferase family 4 protein [Scytolyngbya sp. HA4215-MV1]